MALLNDILEWTKTLPNWQRDAARRLFLNESGLEAKDYDELYLLLKNECGIIESDKLVVKPLAKEHLPTELAVGETVVLKSLRDLTNVNRIPRDQILNFSDQGITVIYGGNGAGKSGYARVMKQACRARDQKEPVHPDVTDPTASTAIPSAKFDIEVSGNIDEVNWQYNATPPYKLSTIAVFDSHCARSYLTAEQDIAYLPYGLDIVENLANVVLPEVTQRLDAEIDKINIDTTPFTHLRGETSVGRQIENLSAKSSPDELTKLGSLSKDELVHLADLDKALAEADPMAKAKELQLSAARLKEYAEEIVKPLRWVNDNALQRLQELVKNKSDAEAVEIKAAENLRSGESLLPGTGEQIWKNMFESARRFSSEVAYPEKDYPNTEKGAVCPLCQESITPTTAERLGRFDEYVKNDIATVANEKRQELETARKKIQEAALAVENKALLAEVKQLNDDLPLIISAFMQNMEDRKQAMLECIKTSDWASIPSLTDNPRLQIRDISAHLMRSSRTFVKAANEERKKKLTLERNELKARSDFAKSLSGILAVVNGMKLKSALESCREQLKTRPISDKSKQFASQAVTAELKKALDLEFRELGVGHIETKLKERSDRGRMYHQLILDLPNTKKIEEILSEGEQRVIAIGSFLAELALANHSCGIIFDDPVSSLDHWRRASVARRLIREAAKRQVIVFTHDTTFLGQLCDEIEATRTPHSMSFLEWNGDAPGLISEGLPWDHQGYKARIDALEKGHRELARSWPQYPNQQAKFRMRHMYDDLRATLERVIQDVVFNGVVKRYRDWIKIDSLDGVVGFAQAEYDDISKLHGKCSDVVSAHDPASAKDATVPSADDLGKDIEKLKTIVEAVKERRRKRKEVEKERSDA
jgi:energy-coupling factor transporter ATP-binding protein EcfA2